ncbi:MAG: nuclear transport factor 2 family protein [Pseudomonadales bacterium]|nr:nuclear transport factor 2 family protein [Pseudomonadales bacterium]
MATNSEIIRDFVEAWSTLDVKKLIEFFAEDGCYYNMPAQPVRGKENVEVLIGNFLASWTETTWDILNISEAGNVVFCERLDRTKTTAGDVDLPCVGVFEMQDGKIKEWRDYFDMSTFVNAMG